MMERRLIRCAVACVGLAACARSGVEPGSGTIGSAGGTFVDSRGLRLVVPPGALDHGVTFAADVVAPPSTLPGTPVSACWHLQPDGLLFLQPTRLFLTAQPSGPAQIVTSESAAGPFEALLTGRDGGELVAQVGHLSIFVGVEPGDGGADAGADAGDAPDAGEDAGSDGGLDAGDDGGTVDGGEPDAGDDAGTACAPLVWDGGAVGCSASAPDAGECSTWRPWFLPGFGYGANQACEAGGGQDLTCMYGTCTCSAIDWQLTFPMPLTPLTCLDQLTQLWNCQCGFPPRAVDPPVCTAPVGGGDGGPFSLPVGSTCTVGTDCQYGVCLNTTYGHICSAQCVDWVCPCNFRCQQTYPQVLANYCMP